MKDIRGDMGTVIKTGKILTGHNNVVSALLMGNPKLVLVSGNCALDVKERLVYYSRLSETPCMVMKESSVEVGSVCGKPFPVSVVAVMDEGESDMLNKIKKETEKSAKSR
ncbi:MAG: 50S ribosomal protein L30e [Candidatus Altiarchaeota archaeon]|nr:50S ribosomal protein L30e [Candidatus Altiarchaeota archaeon]